MAGVDISFPVHNKAVAAAVILELEGLEIIETETLETELFFPYIPGFLGIREVEPSLSVLNTLKHDFDVLMVNGHGVMHPVVLDWLPMWVYFWTVPPLVWPKG